MYVYVLPHDTGDVSTIQNRSKQKIFSMLFKASDRVTFGCASLKELIQWLDASAVVVVPRQGWSRGGVGQTSVPIEKIWGGLLFFCGEGGVGVRFFRVRLVGMQQWYQRSHNRHFTRFRGKKISSFFCFYLYLYFFKNFYMYYTGTCI
jgi:hypothetical protein